MSLQCFQFHCQISDFHFLEFMISLNITVPFYYDFHEIDKNTLNAKFSRGCIFCGVGCRAEYVTINREYTSRDELCYRVFGCIFTNISL
jgi:hypothetical protein